MLGEVKNRLLFYLNPVTTIAFLILCVLARPSRLKMKSAGISILAYIFASWDFQARQKKKKKSCWQRMACLMLLAGRKSWHEMPCVRKLTLPTRAPSEAFNVKPFCQKPKSTSHVYLRLHQNVRGVLGKNDSCQTHPQRVRGIISSAQWPESRFPLKIRKRPNPKSSVNTHKDESL